MTIALTHAVGSVLAECELTFVDRRGIDIDLARRQHAAYRDALTASGVDVRLLDVSLEHPDAVFVEDAAVILDELAIATSMGTPSRRGEVENLLRIVAEYRPVTRVESPATIEGGDVLRVGPTLFVGRSCRTNDAGIRALAEIAEPHGYRVVPVAVGGCLHLKTACTALADDLLLANPAWVDFGPFTGFGVVEVPEDEPFGANTLRLGDTVLMSSSWPRTAERVAARGFVVRTVDIAELEKAEAGVTCLSVVFERERAVS